MTVTAKSFVSSSGVIDSGYSVGGQTALVASLGTASAELTMLPACDGNVYVSVASSLNGLDVNGVTAAIKAVRVYDADGNLIHAAVYPSTNLPAAAAVPAGAAKVEAVVVSAKAVQYGDRLSDVSIEYAQSSSAQTDRSSAPPIKVLLGDTIASLNPLTGEAQTESATLQQLVQELKQFGSWTDADGCIAFTGTAKVLNADNPVPLNSLVTDKPLRDIVQADVSSCSVSALVLSLSGTLVLLKTGTFSLSSDGKLLLSPSGAQKAADLSQVDVSGRVSPSVSSSDAWTVEVRPASYALLRTSSGKRLELKAVFCKGQSCQSGTFQLVCCGCQDSLIDLSAEAVPDSAAFTATDLYVRAGLPPGYLYTLTVHLTLNGISLYSGQTVQLTAPDPASLVELSESDGKLTASSKYVHVRPRAAGRVVGRQYEVSGSESASVELDAPYDVDSYGPLLRSSDEYTLYIDVAAPVNGEPVWKTVYSKQYTYSQLNGQISTDLFLVEPVKRVQIGSGQYMVAKKSDGGTWTGCAGAVGRGLAFLANGTLELSDGVYSNPNVSSAQYSDLGIRIIGKDADPVSDAVQLTDGKLTASYYDGSSVQRIEVSTAPPEVDVELTVSGQLDIPVLNVSSVLPPNAELSASAELTVHGATKTVSGSTAAQPEQCSVSGPFALCSDAQVSVQLLLVEYPYEVKPSVSLCGSSVPFRPLISGDLLQRLYTVKGSSFVASPSVEATVDGDDLVISVCAPEVNGKLTVSSDSGSSLQLTYSLCSTHRVSLCRVCGGKKSSEVTVSIDGYSASSSVRVPNPKYSVDEREVVAELFGWACSLTFKFSGASAPELPSMKSGQITASLQLTPDNRYAKLLSVFPELPSGKVDVEVAETGDKFELDYTPSVVGSWPGAVVVHPLGLTSSQIVCASSGRLVSCCSDPSADGYAVFSFRGKQYGIPLGKPEFSVEYDSGKGEVVYSLDPKWLAPVAAELRVVTPSGEKTYKVAGSGRISVGQSLLLLGMSVVSLACGREVYTYEKLNAGAVGGSLDVSEGRLKAEAYAADEGTILVALVGVKDGRALPLTVRSFDRVALYSEETDLHDADAVVLYVVSPTVGAVPIAWTRLSEEKASIADTVKPAITALLPVLAAAATAALVGTALSSRNKHRTG